MNTHRARLMLALASRSPRRFGWASVCRARWATASIRPCGQRAIRSEIEQGRHHEPDAAWDTKSLIDDYGKKEDSRSS